MKGRGSLRESDFFQKCDPECWSNVRERTFTARLSFDRWYTQYTAVCGRSGLPGGRVDPL